jgi:hypothetical protein
VAELVRRLSEPVVIDRARLKVKRGTLAFVKPLALPGWCPSTFAGNRRASNRVERSRAVVLDFDGTCDFERAQRIYGEFAGFVHTTWSHSEERPCIRVVLLTDRPVSNPEYDALWQVLARLASAWPADSKARAAGRFWQAPVIPAGAVYRCEVLGGTPVAVDLALADVPLAEPVAKPAPRSVPPDLVHGVDLEERRRRARAWLFKAGPAIEGQGGWQLTHTAAARLVRGLALPPDVALAELLAWNRDNRPPWSESDLRQKVEWATRAQHPPIGVMLRPRGAAPAIGNPGEAAALIARIGAAVAALATSGRGVDSDRAVMLALVAVAERTGSIVVALPERPGGERARMNHKTARAALQRCVSKGMLRRAEAPETTEPGTAAFELRPPEEWPERSCCEIGAVRKDTGLGDRYCADFATTRVALEADLWRRGNQGLGPKPLTLLAALVVGPSITGPTDAVKRLPACERWNRSTALRAQQRLADVGLVEGWQPISRDVDALRARIDELEHERGLTGATARQKAEHQRQREAWKAARRHAAASVTLAIERRGGEATVQDLTADLGLSFQVILLALLWLRSERRARCRSDGARVVWSIIAGGERRDPPAPGSRTYVLKTTPARTAAGGASFLRGWGPASEAVGKTLPEGEPEAARPERDGVQERTAPAVPQQPARPPLDPDLEQRLWLQRALGVAVSIADRIELQREIRQRALVAVARDVGAAVPEGTAAADLEVRDEESRVHDDRAGAEDRQRARAGGGRDA